MLVCAWYTELTSGLRQTLWARSSALDKARLCVCMRAYVCDQLSAQVVFMKLSENLFFKVVLEFDLLPHS